MGVEGTSALESIVATSTGGSPRVWGGGLSDRRLSRIAGGAPPKRGETQAYTPIRTLKVEPRLDGGDARRQEAPPGMNGAVDPHLYGGDG